MPVPRSTESPAPTKLRVDKDFQPCPADENDELYQNGIFVFNVTRLLAFIEAHTQRFPVETIGVADIPYYGDEHLNNETILTANLARPILMAEISPGNYNVIDGNHRVAKAKQEGAQNLPVHRVACPWHIPFLISATAYEKYVEYWNSKVKQLRRS